MALTYPLTFPVFNRVQSVSFEISRVEAVSQTRGGLIQAAERGRSLWTCEIATATLRSAEYEQMRAFLSALRGSQKTFLMYDPIRKRPRAYPGVGALPSPTVTAASGYTVSLSGLGAGYMVRAGDMISWPWKNTRTLHRAVEDATANGSGVISGLTVEPDVPAGGTLPQAAAIQAAAAVFRLVEAPAMRRSSRLGDPVTISGLQWLA